SLPVVRGRSPLALRAARRRWRPAGAAVPVFLPLSPRFEGVAAGAAAGPAARPQTPSWSGLSGGDLFGTSAGAPRRASTPPRARQSTPQPAPVWHRETDDVDRPK